MGSVIRRAAVGALAGTLGTLAMDLVWYRRYRASGGEDGFAAWEFATSTTSFDEAAAPGRAGERVAAAVGIDLPDEAAGTTTNVMHWLTGIGYGIVHALAHDGRRNPLVGGATTALGAFTNSYATMGALGIYEPIWDYDGETLAKDLSAHLVFGVTTGLAYRALANGASD